MTGPPRTRDDDWTPPKRRPVAEGTPAAPLPKRYGGRYLTGTGAGTWIPRPRVRKRKRR